MDLKDFTAKDIESVAKGRVNRREGKKTNTVALLSCVAVAAGYFVWLKVLALPGICIIAAGLIVFMVYMSMVNKKAHREYISLRKEWKEATKEAGK